MKIDTPILTKVIIQCFDYAMDDRFSPSQRVAFATLGKRLRGCLLNLLSAQFNAGTQAVIDANQGLNRINQQLTASAKVLADVAGTLQTLAQLVGVLDDLLQLAVGFV